MMVDINSPKPLYEQIKEYILHNIHAGTFAPDTRIPSERDLSRQFGVSRLTVNKAIKELVQAGWLHTQIGKGTFISPETIDQALDTLTSFTEEMSRRGQRTGSRVLQAEIIAAPEEHARMLGIPAGVGMVLLRRVRMANNQPVALETSSFSAAACPGILDRFDFSRDSLYAVWRQIYHLQPTYAEQTFEARQATLDEAHALEINEGDPVLSITRVTFGANDRPLEYVQSAYRGDRYKFRAILRHV
jgi:GntR family transcriptional regulator